MQQQWARGRPSPQVPKLRLLRQDCAFGLPVHLHFTAGAAGSCVACCRAPTQAAALLTRMRMRTTSQPGASQSVQLAHLAPSS